MDINVRINEGCAAQPELLWDSVWNSEAGSPIGGRAAERAAQRGGLQAMRPLDTAVIDSLFTNRRCPTATR